MNLKMSGRLALGLGLGISLSLPLAAAPKIDMAAAEAAMKKSDCFTCHSVKRKVVGPAYIDIAKKYKGNKKAVETLVLKVKNGGSGNWGTLPMAGHPTLSDEDINLMVKWVLAQK